MNNHILRQCQIVPAALDTVFSFFESPRNLEELTPPWLRFEVKTTTDEQMRLGTEIRYRLWWQGVPMGWRSRISEYEPGVMFADEMLRGPYRRWYHRHLFREVDEGVEMLDIVEYRLPLGPLGRLAHSAVVRRQLDSIFAYRRVAVAKRFGEPVSRSPRGASGP